MTLARAAGIAVLLIAAFVASFIATRFALRAPQPPGASAPGNRLFLYQPDYLHRTFEVASRDGRFTAAAGDGGSRTEQATGRREQLSVLSIAEGERVLLKLTQCGDADALWSEFGRIVWPTPASVSFSYANGDGPLDTFRITAFMNER
jgi:hypothetical protein